MNRWLHYLRQLLSGGESGRPCAAVFHRQSAAFQQAQLLVRFFYAANLFWAAIRLEERARWDVYEALHPLWPLFWADGADVNVFATYIFTFNTVVAFVAVMFPASGTARILAFAGVLLAGALENSFGRICHYGHAWVWVTLFFAFLPAGTPRQLATSRILRQRFLQMFWAAQFAILFFYSMAGWLKLVTVPVQLPRGEVCAVAPEALARHIANCLLQTNPQPLLETRPLPLLAEWLVNHVWIGWPLFLGAIYLEAFSVLIAFRPALHRWWGDGLILLHLGIGLGMDIWFVPAMFLLALLLVNSPFHREETPWRQLIWQLPGLDLLHYLWQRFRPIQSP